MAGERSAKLRFVWAGVLATPLLLVGCAQWNWDRLRDPRALEIEHSLAIKKPAVPKISRGQTVSAAAQVPAPSPDSHHSQASGD